MASKSQGTLYTGVTSNLVQRVAQHKAGTFDGCTKRYGCKMLVFYACFDRMEDAILEEKRIKGGSRADKIARIEN